MSQVFDVKEAKKTGYCKNNKAHTYRVSDGEALLIAEALGQ